MTFLVDWGDGVINLDVVAPKCGGEVVLFVSGLGLSTTLWEEGIEYAQHNGYSAVAIDLPGFGLSSELPIETRHDFQCHAKAIEYVADLFDWEIHLVLHSMASVVLTELSSLSPKSITLLEGNVTGADTKWSNEIVSMEYDELVDYVKKLRRLGSFSFSRVLKQNVSQERLNRLALSYEQMSVRAFYETSLDGHAKTNLGLVSEAIDKFKCPKTIFRGSAAEFSTSRKNLTNLGFKIYDVADAGHFLMVDKPLIVYGKIFHS